jgi:hypothetical protein
MVKFAKKLKNSHGQISAFVRRDRDYDLLKKYNE